MIEVEDPAKLQVHYEVHVLHVDRWLIDCTSRDETEALDDAREIARKPDVSGVRVIKETYNPKTERAAGRIIYNYEKPQKERSRRHVVVGAQPRPLQRPAAEAPAIEDLLGPPRLPPRPTAATPIWTGFAGVSLALAALASMLFLGLLLAV